MAQSSVWGFGCCRMAFHIQEDFEDDIIFEPQHQPAQSSFTIEHSAEPDNEEFVDALEGFSEDILPSASGWRPGLDTGPFLSRQAGAVDFTLRITKKHCCLKFSLAGLGFGSCSLSRGRFGCARPSSIDQRLPQYRKASEAAHAGHLQTLGRQVAGCAPPGC